MIKDTLTDLGISELTGRVYTILLDRGPATARKIAASLSIPRTSIYYHLETLKNIGLIAEVENNENKLFQAENPKRLSQLIEDKISRLKKEDILLARLAKQYSKQNNYSEPRLKFLQGRNGLRQLLRDALWYENIEMLSMWPFGDMVPIFGEDFLTDWNKRRIDNSCSLRTIWPAQIVNFKQYPFAQVGKKFLREMRLAPKKFKWNMGYIIYADKIVFISSEREGFGFTIQSRELVELMTLNFENFWPMCQMPRSN